MSKQKIPPSIKAAMKRLRRIATVRAVTDDKGLVHFAHPYPYEIETELMRAYRLGWRAGREGNAIRARRGPVETSNE